MLLWPWIFLAIIWARGSIQMSDHVAKVAKNYPQRISFFVTLLANIVSIIVSIIFSTAIARFSREWATNNNHVTVFHVSLISAFRNQSWPWGMKDHKYLLVRNRWLPVFLAGACIAAFALVPSGATSLIAPVSFSRTWNLTGTELNFSPNNTNCIDWLTALPDWLPNTCDYGGFNDQRGKDCNGKNQLVDLLDSGRSRVSHKIKIILNYPHLMNPSVQIQSLFSNNSDSESLNLGQLGTNNSFRVLGPPRGVLPISPNGIGGLVTLPPPLIRTSPPSPLSDAETNAAILSYNYTLDHQGFASSLSCMYDTQSPIRFSAVTSNNLSVSAQGFCNEIGLASFLGLESVAMTTDTDRILIFWACKSTPSREQDPPPTDYYIYLRGLGEIYEKSIGNISCVFNSMQLPIFPVTYQSTTRVFSTQERNTTSERPHNFDIFIEQALFILGTAVQQAQTTAGNLVASSVQDLGIMTLGVGLYAQDEMYLPLYEAMMQGMLVNEVCTASNSSRSVFMAIPQLTYIRFLYSTALTNAFESPPPASCIRTVNGTLSAGVMGWVAKPVHIGFLMPMTILNLASLIIMSISMARAKRGCHEIDLTDPRSLVSAESSLEESDHSGWTDGVSYRSREVREYQI